MLRRVCLAGSVAWAAIIPFAAFVASRPQGPSFGYAFALGAYVIGHVICHQIPARSFQMWGAVLPVCARCTGIYVGAAVVSAAVWARPRAPVDVPLDKVFHHDPASRARRLLAAALAPTAMTLIYEWTTGITPANWVRALAGLPLGATVAWLIATLNPSIRVISYPTVRATTVERSQSGGLVLLCLASWVVPGAGHLWLGRRQKGLVFLVALPLMFAIGLALQGRLFPFQLSDLLVCLEAIADVGIGLPYFIASALSLGAGDVRAVTYEYGNAFLVVAGLLNLLVVIDAYDIARGRK